MQLILIVSNTFKYVGFCHFLLIQMTTKMSETISNVGFFCIFLRLKSEGWNKTHKYMSLCCVSILFLVRWNKTKCISTFEIISHVYLLKDCRKVQEYNSHNAFLRTDQGGKYLLFLSPHSVKWENSQFSQFVYIFEESVFIFQFLNAQLCQTKHNCEFHHSKIEKKNIFLKKYIPYFLK